MEHWILSLAFVLVLIFILVEEGKARGAGGGQVNPEGAVKMINRDDAAILDVRSIEAFKRGHLINAINIPKDDIESKMARLKKYEDKPLLVVCERGSDSNRIALTLRRKGFTQPKVLAGGIEAWKTAKLPLSKG